MSAYKRNHTDHADNILDFIAAKERQKEIRVGYARPSDHSGYEAGGDEPLDQKVKFHLDPGDQEILSFCAQWIYGTNRSRLIHNVLIVADRLFTQLQDASRYQLWTREDGLPTPIDILSVDTALEPTNPGQSTLMTSKRGVAILDNLSNILGEKSRRLIIRHCIRTIGVLIQRELRGGVFLYDSRAPNQQECAFRLPTEQQGRDRKMHIETS